MQTFTTGYCRDEQLSTRWRFAGFATATGAENTLRPRAFYRHCCTCTLKVLTLGGLLDVPDALGLCLAVMVEYKRLKGQLLEALFDEENVLGELNAYVWHLYNRWDPSHGAGTGTFRGYATAILRQKIKTFIARDTGDVAGGRTFPKAYSRSVSISYEGLTEHIDNPAGVSAGNDELDVGRGGSDFVLGAVNGDSTADAVVHNVWRDIA